MCSFYLILALNCQDDIKRKCLTFEAKQLISKVRNKN